MKGRGCVWGEVREGGQGGQTDGINVYMTNQNELPSVYYAF